MTGKEGHRDRMKRRFEAHGLDNFADVNVLELLLFYAIPRRETNTLAHRLLDAFGSLEDVFAAPAEDIAQVDGIGPNTAIFLNMLPQVFERLQSARETKANQLTNTEERSAYAMQLLRGHKEKAAYLVCLTSGKNIICTRKIDPSAIDMESEGLRQLVEIAISTGAACVLICENEIGRLKPPALHEQFNTATIRVRLDLFDIKLDDHIIVCGNQYVSMQDIGAFRLKKPKPAGGFPFYDLIK